MNKKDIELLAEAYIEENDMYNPDINNEMKELLARYLETIPEGEDVVESLVWLLSLEESQDKTPREIISRQLELSKTDNPSQNNDALNNFIGQDPMKALDKLKIR